VKPDASPKASINGKLEESKMLRKMRLKVLFMLLLVAGPFVPLTPPAEAYVVCYWYENSLKLTYPSGSTVCALIGPGCSDCVCYLNGNPYPCS
jgi:hypothetical protein